MSQSKLFEYAVIYHPKGKKDEDAKKSELLVKPTYELATSDKEVAMLAARAVPEAHLGHLELIEIVVRPFN